MIYAFPAVLPTSVPLCSPFIINSSYTPLPVPSISACLCFLVDYKLSFVKY